MKKYLLDTNHLSNALRVQSSLRERIFRECQLGSKFATGWPALCELEEGLVQLADSSRYRQMLTILMREIRTENWTAP